MKAGKRRGRPKKVAAAGGAAPPVHRFSPGGFDADLASAAGLDPSTSPAAIAADQRAAVAESLGRLGPGASDTAVSLDAVLPADVVRRRRAELLRMSLGVV